MQKSHDTENTKKPTLTVEYSTTASEEYDPIYAYSLKVEILEASGISDHLFVFQRSPDNNEGDSVDTFIQIAAPLEIEEVPENAPDPQHGMPYYRAKEVTLWFRTLEDLKLAKNKIRDDLETLVRTYEVLNNDIYKKEIETYG